MPSDAGRLKVDYHELQDAATALGGLVDQMNGARQSAAADAADRRIAGSTYSWLSGVVQDGVVRAVSAIFDGTSTATQEHAAYATAIGSTVQATDTQLAGQAADQTTVVPVQHLPGAVGDTVVSATAMDSVHQAIDPTLAGTATGHVDPGSVGWSADPTHLTVVAGGGSAVDGVAGSDGGLLGTTGATYGFGPDGRMLAPDQLPGGPLATGGGGGSGGHHGVLPIGLVTSGAASGTRSSDEEDRRVEDAAAGMRTGGLDAAGAVAADVVGAVDAHKKVVGATLAATVVGAGAAMAYLASTDDEDDDEDEEQDERPGAVRTRLA